MISELCSAFFVLLNFYLVLQQRKALPKGNNDIKCRDASDNTIQSEQNGSHVTNTETINGDRAYPAC